MASYCASKSALLRICESFFAEVRAHGVNVNCVLPTAIDTPENPAAMPTFEWASWMASHDLAQVVAHLFSDAARCLHGASIPVSGRV